MANIAQIDVRNKKGLNHLFLSDLALIIDGAKARLELLLFIVLF